MVRQPIFACLVSLLLLSLSQRAAAAELPFSSRDHLIWVKVAVPGFPAPFNFLLDSGASVSVIDRRVAQRLGMKSAREVTVQGIHSRTVAFEWNGFAGSVGEIPLPQKVLAVDLSHVSRGCHQPIDGLIGADFFRGRVVQLDYAAGRLRIFPRRAAPPMTGIEIPIALRNDAMCVRVALGAGGAKWTRLDTGCDSELHWVIGSERERSLRGASIGATVGASGQVCADVRLGSERLRGVKTTTHARPIFSGEAGLVGNRLLSRFTVTFDRDGKRLYLSRR